MAASNDFVRARIDPAIKAQAAEVLEEMGLTVSDVVRLVLTKVARDRALPFRLDIPNAESRAAMEEARAMAQAEARFPTADALLNDIDQAGAR
ncbi:MAG TPA: type II toxin-antitoxin system RelB/DinJ family antitoxin [Alphaproteobacteria bacterium]|nr:type II toxin-antitoxin system RelB/DinJ family antitoxin [Alphaproteobacteria bacterium]